MKLKKLTEKFQEELIKSHERYMEAYEEFNKHANKKVEDVGLEEVNRLLGNIQARFQELSPALTFIRNNREFSANCINSYNEFIDDLKKQGAHEIIDA